MDMPQHIVPYLKKAYDDLQEPLTKFLRDANLIGSYATLHHTNEFGVLDMFRYVETLKGAQVFAPKSCMEIECESLKLLESICGKLVISVGLLPPSFSSLPLFPSAVTPPPSAVSLFSILSVCSVYVLELLFMSLPKFAKSACGLV
ncbi:hypothetical protein JHK85_007257 [Glycine max]|nr:hypothetical protein JHK85_007257 [Glycine max]